MKIQRTTVRRWLRDILVVIVIVFAIGKFQTRDSKPPGEMISPEIKVDNWDGAELVLNDILLGKPNSLLYFWAPWCGVCKVSIANAVSATGWNNSHNHIFLIALDYGNRKEVEEFVAEQGLRPESVYFGGDRLRDEFRISAYPTYYIANSAGKVRSSVVGYSTVIGIYLRLLINR